MKVATAEAYLLTIARNLFLSERKRANKREPLRESIQDDSLMPDVLAELKDEARMDENLAEVIRGMETEIDLFLNHYDDFGYVFYMMHKP